MSAFLIDCTFKSSLVLMVALVLAWLLRNRSASLRHSIWSAALLTILALPGLILLVPGGEPNLNLSTVTALSPPVTSEVSTEGVRFETLAADQSTDLVEPSASISTAIWVWLFGSIITAAILITEAVRLARVAYASEPFFDSRWFRMTQELSRRFELNRGVRFAQNKTAKMLVTWGALHPRVLLPPGADAWSDHRISAVLGHELAHIRRHDWFFQLAGECVRSIYWFNPLVWFACNRLRQESERACDDAVLGLGMESTDYASELLNLARLLKSASCSWASSLAMARPSTLERRFAAMLNPRLDRRSLSWKAALAVVAGTLCVTLSIAGMQSPVQDSTGRLFGRVYDPKGAPIKNAAITIYSSTSSFKAVVTSNATGIFEFLRVPPGEYELQTSATGFEPFRIHAVKIEASQEVNLNVMTVAAATPGTTTKAAVTIPAAAPSPTVETKREPAPVRKETAITETAVVPTPAQQVQPPAAPEPPPQRIRLGGNSAAANLVYQVKPIYPDEAKDKRISGVVIVETVIGTDGVVQSTNVISGHPLLVQPAIDAVSQWRYTPILLNGVPVEVLTTVTVNFSLNQ